LGVSNAPIYASKKSTTATAELRPADCNTPYWPVSHYSAPWKNPPHEMRHLVKIIWPLVINHCHHYSKRRFADDLFISHGRSRDTVIFR